jgi:prepilin-type N-terminal cleavage/methylation domain-containing protein
LKGKISTQRQKLVGGDEPIGGFTLIELLIVLGVISLLLAILLPALSKIRQQAKTIININNQHQTINSVNLFSMDNSDRYPESVATVGFGSNWNWTDPTKLTSTQERAVGLHRAISEYLRSYLPTAEMLYCPNGPDKYKDLQAAWDAGDDWDNPDSPFPLDPVGGNYCFYWNYIGYLPDQDAQFFGPKTSVGSARTSRLIMTDYFGYDHWRSPYKYGSCERFKKSGIVPQTWKLSSYWYRDDNVTLAGVNIKIRAAYTDGHVQTYSTADMVPMKVSINSEGTVPYPDGIGPGIFYLPRDAIR